eukprot:984334_1
MGRSSIAVQIGSANSLTFVLNSILFFILQFLFTNVKTENIIQKLTPIEGLHQYGDEFGRTVSMHNNFALVGAQRIDSAYIFENMQGNWTRVATLSPRNASGSYFGSSVAIYNQTALIGAYKDNSNAGSAYIFSKNASDEWVQETKLLPSDPYNPPVSIHGNWTEVRKLQPTNDTLMNQYRESVSIHKNYALIGQFGFFLSSAAYVFERVNATWNQVAKLQPMNATSSDDRFGYSVSIHNEYALIGAFDSDDNGDDSGSAYVFHNINGSWTQVAKLLPDDGTAFDSFGFSVSIHDKQALIGACRENNDGGDDAGAAYVFERRSIHNWIQIAKVVPNDIATNDFFGTSVCLDNDYALIGTKSFTTREGSAYMIRNSFTLSPTAAPTQAPSAAPSQPPTRSPSAAPTQPPTISPTNSPSQPTQSPSASPTIIPTQAPTITPTYSPTISSLAPSESPTLSPTSAPIAAPTKSPTRDPTPSPIACPYNTFQPISGECFTCTAGDDGYLCEGGSSVNVAYGYWVFAYIENQNSAKFTALPLINNSYEIIGLRCPAGQCCANHTGCKYMDTEQSPTSNVFQMNEMLCAKHRNISSLTCSRCNDDYYQLLGTSACGKCNDTDYIYVVLVFIMALIFTVFLLFCLARPTEILSNIMSDNDEIHWRKLIWYDQRTLVTVLVFKIYLYYYQGLSQLLSTKNITPTSQFAETLLTLFNFDVSILSVSNELNEGICFIVGIESGIHELVLSYTWYICISIHVIIIAFVYFVYTKLFSRANALSFKPYIKAGCIYIMLMIVGPLLSTSFKFLTCIKF